MRLFINMLVVAGLAVLALVYFSQQRAGEQSLALEEQVRTSLKRLYERTTYHGALQLSEAMDRNERPALPYPVAIEPAWFGGDQPGNALVSDTHPWLDVAPLGDDALHPPDPVLYHDHQAGVWYNPNNGVFRARTPPAAGDELTLARYNRINATELQALPRDGNPDRAPLAYTPGSAPATALAHVAPDADRDDRAADVFFDDSDFEWLGDTPQTADGSAGVHTNEPKAPRPTLLAK